MAAIKPLPPLTEGQKKVWKKVKKIIKANQGHKQLLLHVSDVNWDYEIKRTIQWLIDTGARMAYIDLFCGAGGTSTGVEQAMYGQQKTACVVLGINHDKEAIQSHQANHPNTLHLVEDVREVNLAPIAKMVEAIRAALPHIKIVLWASAECTNHSKAKGGDSRDPDSRSLPEELYRYIQAFRPDLIQIENVVEFRIWVPVIPKNINQRWNEKLKEYYMVKPIEDVTKWKHKITHKLFGRLYSKNGSKWFSKKGIGYTKDSEKGIVQWWVPDKRFIWTDTDGKKIGSFYHDWREHIKSMGYQLCGDRDINSATVGAVTARTRYFGQFSSEMPLHWPTPTHSKTPEKLHPAYGQLKPFRACRDVLDLHDTGEGIFDPNRKKKIESPKTFGRVLQGCMRFVPGGKERYEDFIIRFNSEGANGTLKQGACSIDRPAPTVCSQPRLGKVNVQFITSYHAGQDKDNEGRNYSLEEPCRTVDTQNRFALTHIEEVIPFLVQYNNNSKPNDVDKPCPPVLTKDKHYLAQTQFIQQGNTGDPKGMVADLGHPARTLTCKGGNQSIVDVEQILPFIRMYYSNGHNCHSVNDPAPTIPCADNSSIVTPQPFILRYFSSGGGQLNDIDGPTGGMTTVPKMNLVTPEEVQWIMNPSFDNVGSSVEEPAQTILASRKHQYLMSHHFDNGTSSVDGPAPTVVAQQGKKPMHLVQVQEGDESFFGIVIYSYDCKEVRELKRFMAANNIVDIKMRMLNVGELLRIQGFPTGYILKGSQTNQKKFIGNSVEVTTAMKMAECYGEYLYGDVAMAV